MNPHFETLQAEATYGARLEFVEKRARALSCADATERQFWRRLRRTLTSRRPASSEPCYRMSTARTSTVITGSCSMALTSFLLKSADGD